MGCASFLPMLEALPLLAALAAPTTEPKIELYTMGQGEHLFERFGHAAICVVHDRAPERTLCYNYGTTDFGSPPEELGWDFLRGRARFWVSVWPLQRMLDSYAGDDRSIWRQRLPLSSQQVAQIARALEHDAKEENRYYLYHHFFDNCSTRVRDVIDRAVGGALERNAREPHPLTFREIGRRGLAETPLALVLGDLLVGREADRRPSEFEAMFIPDVMRAEVLATLGAAPEQLYVRQGRAFRRDPPHNAPWQIALAVVVSLPLALAKSLRRAVQPALIVTGILLGTIGSAVWLVAVVSSVPELRGNELLALLWPTDLALGAFGPRWRLRYAKLRLAVLLSASVLSVIGVLRQPLLLWIVVAAAPMVLALVGRQPERASSTTAATA
jgi:hypothetical protein